MVDSDDTVLDTEFESEEEAEGGVAAVQKLREKLKKAVEEKQEYLEGWQRSRADFANFKREEASLHSDREERIKSEFAEAVIPTLDSFEMALGSKSFKEGSAEWQKGISSLYQGLISSLSQVGIKQFVPKGEKFDPYKHEALREVETSDEKFDHTIETVERSGYSIGDRIIRPAQVSVYTHKTQ